jgi:hypothetical protein
MDALTPAQYKFLTWMALNHPEVLDRALQILPIPAQAAAPGLGDLNLPSFSIADSIGLTNFGTGTGTASSSGGVLSSIGNWFKDLAPVIQGVGQAVVTVKAQNDLMKINLERAKQGLDPLSAQEAGTAVGVSVGVDPATAKAATVAAMIPLALIGVGAYFLFTSNNRPRRR